MTDDVLTRFSPATAAWFRGSFSAPTAAQTGAWTSISSGQHTLVVAPTGSGKTLSAFLWALDRLATEPTPEKLKRCRVLYVSPLKALSNDIRKNLQEPLEGIRRSLVERGLADVAGSVDADGLGHVECEVFLARGREDITVAARLVGPPLPC